MAVTCKKHITYLFNSDPASGSSNLSSDGSSFSVALSPPLHVPRSAIACEVFVPQASVWNSSPNISVAFTNNTYTFTTSSVAAPGTYTVTFPDGLYSLDDIGAYLSAALVNLGLPANLFTFSGMFATSQTVLTFLLSGDSVDFSTATTVGTILGYASAIITAPVAGYNAFSTGPAILNRNNGYLISGTFLTNGGIPINNYGAGVLASIPINVAPGSLINYTSQLPIAIQAGELIGALKTNFSFNLTNTSLRATPTGGGTTTQFWSFMVIVEYEVLISEAAQRNM